MASGQTLHKKMHKGQDFAHKGKQGAGLPRNESKKRFCALFLSSASWAGCSVIIRLLFSLHSEMT